jgi:hypothetical protein
MSALPPVQSMLIAGYGLPVFPNEYACVVTIVTGVNKIKPCGEFPIKVIEEAPVFTISIVLAPCGIVTIWLLNELVSTEFSEIFIIKLN